jgi:hypothetical protein
MTPRIYGETFGWARVRHVRAALQKLYEEGRTATPPKGLDERTIIQPARQPRTA